MFTQIVVYWVAGKKAEAKAKETKSERNKKQKLKQTKKIKKRKEKDCSHRLVA